MLADGGRRKSDKGRKGVLRQKDTVHHFAPVEQVNGGTQTQTSVMAARHNR